MTRNSVIFYSQLIILYIRHSRNGALVSHASVFELPDLFQSISILLSIHLGRFVGVVLREEYTSLTSS